MNISQKHIDNTNTMSKEFSPYVKEAQLKRYRVKICYPETPAAIKVGQYFSTTRDDVVINEDLETEILESEMALV